MTAAVSELAALLAAAYLRVVARRAASVDGLHKPSAAAVAQIFASSATEIPGVNEGCLGRETSPPVSVPGGKAAGDDGERR